MSLSTTAQPRKVSREQRAADSLKTAGTKLGIYKRKIDDRIETLIKQWHPSYSGRFDMSLDIERMKILPEVNLVLFYEWIDRQDDRHTGVSLYRRATWSAGWKSMRLGEALATLMLFRGMAAGEAGGRFEDRYTLTVEVVERRPDEKGEKPRPRWRLINIETGTEWESEYSRRVRSEREEKEAA
jgi:hypothetical protein